ncbi:DNA-processing protein DprA [Chelatococcus asaccharovorans]|uniref:DNA-processing protein DprA n=1 Tax=Chelatococcus asaccharovorans TaxID=28210 RepID=UPI00224C6681|nr:DNA-processing protein DprA [Chelatococcus asaccharovorans]CAH1667072.1 DNA processing protein [Chelatococcus asaccharovorans]CAH1681173.1 DNA processing protein [Chelatococcus asaccharovorans]
MGGLRLTDDQRLSWLRLMRSESIGPRSFRSLLSRYGSADAALAALPEIARRRGRPLRIATLAEVEREMASARRLGVRFLALGEAEYPTLLREIDSAPPLIAVRGEGAALGRPMVAIVGSRNASAAGLKFTERLAAGLGKAGFVVVSGLARGIDTRAHVASLASGTVAVLAGGHDRIYPAENEGLLARILSFGAVLSEMPMGYEPRGRDFPRRNRIVSGLCFGVVVVEAARRSGSLITARFAAEQGREVFAVPGSPLDPRAEGTNDLIRDGATLCADPDHVVSALAPLIGQAPPPTGAWNEHPVDRGGEPLWDELEGLDVAPPPAMPIPPAYAAGETDPDLGPEGAPEGLSSSGPLAEGHSPHGRHLLALLGPQPLPLDDLSRASGLAAREIQRAIVELELGGYVQRHANNSVSLK